MTFKYHGPYEVTKVKRNHRYHVQKAGGGEGLFKSCGLWVTTAMRKKMETRLKRSSLEYDQTFSEAGHQGWTDESVGIWTMIWTLVH